MTTSIPESDGEPDRPRTLDPAAAACLRRTRNAVLNIIVATGLLLVVSGLVVREVDFGVPRLPQVAGQRAAYATLLGLVVASYATRRALGSRSSLRDPRTRGPRFYLAHVVGAVIGALAVPLGFAYGVAVRPEVSELAPFWVAGMALGFLALPRTDALADFDTPMAGAAAPRSPRP